MTYLLGFLDIFGACLADGSKNVVQLHGTLFTQRGAHV
jgi:hypothetical protein